MGEFAGARLNIGSGPTVAPGWTSIDGSWQARLASRPRLARLVSRLTGRQVGHWPPGITCLDVRRGLPFAENSVSVVYSSHMIEHLFREEAVALLLEVRRVLAPGGICRIVIPDLRSMLRWYTDGAAVRSVNGDDPRSDRLMEMLGMSSRSAPPRSVLGVYRRVTDFERHKWMYDEAGLSALFRESGFDRARAYRSLESDIPSELLAAVENPDRIEGGAGICMEARKST